MTGWRPWVACLAWLAAGLAWAQPSEGPGAIAAEWLQRMVATERRFAFAVAPEERSAFPSEAIEPALGFAWPAGATPDLVRANFDVGWVGRERLAGRPTAVIELVPRHVGPAWRFWVDVETGARVAYRATLSDGTLVAEGRGDPRSLRPVADGRPLPAPRTPEGGRGAAWRAAFGGLDGFEPVAVDRVRFGDGVRALRVTLWDGLSGAVLLVYPTSRSPARGATFVTRAVGELTLALVGPVAADVAARYLDALAARRWTRADLGALLREWVPDGEGAD